MIQRFKTYLNEYGDPNTARRCVVKDFYEALRASVERMIGIEYPEIARHGTVNNQEQAAYRVFHDILPAYITRDNGHLFSVTDPKTLKTMLTENELNQNIPFYNGHYDPEYKNIQTGAPWYAKKFFGAPSHINLMALDSAFIQTYGEHFTQASGLQELCDYANGQCEINKVSFVHHIVSMFEKAQCKYNQDATKTLNPWIPDSIKCLLELKNI